MKAWIKKTSGLLLGSILAIALSGKAYADVEAGPELPDTPPAVHEEMEVGSIVTEEIPVNDAAAATVTDVPAVDVPLEAVVTNDEQPISETPAALSASLAVGTADVSAPLSAAAVDVSSEQEPLFSVAGVIFDGNSDQSEGWGDGGGWKYESDSGRIAMVNFAGVGQSIASDGAGVTIVAAGLNRLDSLSCEGDINIIGSGILLVDSIEMPEGSRLNLLSNQEIYGENGGSVAVFVKTGENTYTLVNGADAVGLLDGEYNVPEGITLIVPEDASLCLQSVVQVVETYEQDDREIREVRYYTDTCPEENGLHEDLGSRVEFIANAAVLRVSNLLLQKGSAGNAGKITLRNAPYFYNKSVVSMLHVSSRLILDGLIEGGRVNLAAGIELSGAGGFQDSQVALGGGEEANHVRLALSDSSLNITGGNVMLDELRVSGESLLRYTADTVLGDLSIVDNGILQIRSNSSIEDSATLTLSGACSGGKILLESGRYDLRMNSEDLAASSTEILAQLYNTIEEQLSDALVFDDAGYFSERSDAPMIVSPEQATVPEAENGILTIPAIQVSVRETESFKGNHVYIKSYNENVAGYLIGGENNPEYLDYDGLKSFYASTLDEDVTAILFEVMIKSSDGTLRMEVLSEDNARTLSPEGVFLIRVLGYVMVRDGQGGEAITTTGISFTGSGVLGGAGAGSVTGGNSKPVYSGSGISRNRITIHDPDPVDPDPVKPDPVDPDPVDPDPVKPDPGQQDIAAQILRVETTAHGECYILSVFDHDRPITDLNGHAIAVHMAFLAPESWNGGSIYVVFRNADGSLTAYEASFDPATGMLIFESALTGEFVVVCLDYDGEAFSAGFYAALEALPELKSLR